IRATWRTAPARRGGRPSRPLPARPAASLAREEKAATVSFDDLVGAGEDRWRDRQAERLGGVEIDDQLECCRLLDRRVGRLGALADLPDVNANPAMDNREAGPIADQAAGRGVLPARINRRNGMARGQYNELLAAVAEKRISLDNERIGLHLVEGSESRVDLAFGAGL